MANYNKWLLALAILHLLFAIVLGIANSYVSVEVNNIPALYKPIKFALSISIYAFTMAWLLRYWQNQKAIRQYSRMAFFVMLYEQLVITVQAFRGELSHFNNTSSLELLLFGLMGVFITWLTLHTAYLLILFMKQKEKCISIPFALSIQWGLFIFIVFSLQGGYMGYLYSHSINATDSDPGIPFINWNLIGGDLRVAHFAGIHALQLMPLIGKLLEQFKGSKHARSLVHLVGIGYLIGCVYLLWMALQGVSIV